MLWIGALVPLGQAAVAWRWRFSVRDEMRAQNGSLLDATGGGNTSEPTHVVIADYTPSFERALAASKGDQVMKLPQSTETSEVRARQTTTMLTRAVGNCVHLAAFNCNSTNLTFVAAVDAVD
jgi:hypothetical protein